MLPPLPEAALRVPAALGHRGELVRLPGGSVPVYGVGDDVVLKLFPPGERLHAIAEVRALAAVDGRLPIPTPRPIASGQVEGWDYVLMSRLHGRPLAEVWPALTARDRDRLATELGHALAALRAIDDADLGEASIDWDAFLAAQRTSAVDRQRARGLDERWLEPIAAFLDATPLTDRRRSMLHTELMREHLLVTPDGDGWSLSGLFDFEPAMVGAPEYDLASFGVFVSCGDGRFLRRALLASGTPGHALDEALQRRLLAYAILHRYSNLRWYLERVPPRAGDDTLDALARRWWSLDATPSASAP